MDGSFIDALPRRLLDAGVVAADVFLDGSLSIVDVSRRNRNFKVTWGASRVEGMLLKLPSPSNASTKSTLENEARFYAACDRCWPIDFTLPIPQSMDLGDPSLGLALRLVPNATSLWDARPTLKDLDETYAAIGRALGELHRFTRSEIFLDDIYVRSLLRRKPWALELHKPGPETLQTLSPAVLQMHQILREFEVGPFLDNVNRVLEKTCVIHGDVKADNILISSDTASPPVTLVDWELAQVGDPAWDVGATLRDLLVFWLLRLPLDRNTSFETLLARAELSLGSVQGAARAFWRCYLQVTGGRDADDRALLDRAIRSSAALLIQSAYDVSCTEPVIGNHAVVLLQLAVNIFRSPSLAAEALYGL